MAISKFELCIILTIAGVLEGISIDLNPMQMLEKGDNITDQMVIQIKSIIVDASVKCTNFSDYSCFSQFVSLKIENNYGKSWNVHVFNTDTVTIKGAHYSDGKWISFVKEGQNPDTQFAYYIFKPASCSKFLNHSLISKQYLYKEYLQGSKEYWGTKMSATLQERVKSLIKQAASQFPTMEQNTEYIKSKMGPGRWEIIIWDSDSMDYFDSCMFQSYFGILIGFETGQHAWSYYIGRMSRL